MVDIKRKGEGWLGQQTFAAVEHFLRDLYAKSGEGQVYQISPEGGLPWLLGIFHREANDTRSHFSGLELVVIREVPAIVGDGKERFVQLARFDRFNSAATAHPVGYAEGDLVPDGKRSLRPSWFEVTKLRGNAMSDVIKLAPPDKRDQFSPITKGESARRAWQLVGKLEEHSASLKPIESTLDFDLFR